MSIIIITAKSLDEHGWLSGDGKYNDIIFREICKKVKKGFTEDLRNDCGWKKDSIIDDFVILKANSERIESSKMGRLYDRFSYEMDTNSQLSPENKLVLIELYGKNSGEPNDYVKWRVRNTFGKIIDKAGHSNGFGLEAKTIYAFQRAVVHPTSTEEIFYLIGSKEFKNAYMEKVPKEFKKQRITKL